MRTLLIFSLILLGGCSPKPLATDISGLWINQAAIDSAAQGRSLLQAIGANGLNLEWNIDTRTGKAQFSNAFEAADGQLLPNASGNWTVDYNGHGTDELQSDGTQLTQLPTESYPGQVFRRAAQPAPAGARWGTTFRQALNAAYMAGKWKIIEGPGVGSTVEFTADGRLSGLTQNDRYELCLGGGCATQGAGNDTLLLGNVYSGDGFIFVRYGKRMELLKQINLSRPDEIPQLTPGARQWLLEKQ